ncbi:ABC transporter ATP-binding protein [Frondihabitans cladoniiphilus]|uniref:ABC transporter ATP-binding protein n=1 Tax=Frondihabitans cladoniiphilus TaxID=715785 RepID=A0ABP8W3Z7_9MICO
MTSTATAPTRTASLVSSRSSTPFVVDLAAPWAPVIAFSLQRVTKTYRQGRHSLRALKRVDLEIAPGESVALHGPAGSGKSTLLHLLAGLERPTSGAIALGTHDLTGAGDRTLSLIRTLEVGFVFSRVGLISTLTAAENVVATPTMADVPPADRRRSALAALESVGLADQADRLAAELSESQRQRVALARALVNEPTVLLVDEPGATLDSSARAEFLDLLDGVRRDRGLTLVVATDDASVAAHCSRRLALKNGRVAEAR